MTSETIPKQDVAACTDASVPSCLLETGPANETTEATRLRLVIVAECDAAALALAQACASSGMHVVWTRAETEEAFVPLLGLDVAAVVAYLDTGQFTAMRALQCMQESTWNIPLVVVANARNEAQAADCLARGAADYLFTDRLGRLGAAVQSAMAVRRLREEKRSAEEHLAYADDVLRTFMDYSPDQIYIKDKDSRFIRINQAQAWFLGIERPEQAIGKTDFDFFLPERAEQAFNDEQTILNTGLPLINSLEDQNKHLSSPCWILTTKLPIRRGDEIVGTAGISRNITELKESEERVRQHAERLSALRTIDIAITGSLDLRVTMSIVLEQVTTLLAADAAHVFVLSPHTLMLEHVAERGFRGCQPASVWHHLAQGHAKQVANERRSISVADLRQERIVYGPLVHEQGFVAYTAVPLIARGQVKGVLEVFHRGPLAQNEEWRSLLETLAGQAAIAVDSATLFEDLQQSHTELTRAYDSTIEGWAHALDLRDKETEGHSQRVTELSLRLARRLGVTGSDLLQIRRGALLHDIGKLGVPDAILLKPGPLSDEEWALMRRHPAFAYEMLGSINYLRPAMDIPYCHHEKWDGSGYPQGLKGDHIPLAARIFAIADIWDALRSDRPYRLAWPETKVRAHITSLAGTHLEPRVVEAFLDLMVEETAPRRS